MNWGLIPMLKNVLDERVAEVKNNTKTALQTLFDNINKGQQNSWLKYLKLKNCLTDMVLNIKEV